MSDALSSDDILQTDDLEREAVEVERWGGTVYVRELTGRERDQFENEILTGDPNDPDVNTENLRARLLVRTLCDEDGNRLFGDDQMDDLADKSGAVLSRLFEKAQELNGMTAEDMEAIAGN